MTDVNEAVSCAIQNQSYGRWHKVTKYLNDTSRKASSWENTVLECQMSLEHPQRQFKFKASHHLQ